MPARRGRSRPTLEQVAAHSGVSRATVSRVVNGSASVAPELAQVVARSVAELGYVPNHAARALATRRTDTVALVASEPDARVFSDPFFGAIVRGVSQELIAASVQLTLFMVQSPADLERVEHYLVSGHVDGALLVSLHGHDRLASALARAGVPLVVGGRPMDTDLVVPFVDNDNVAGGRLAARRLLWLGRRRIATVTGPTDMSAGVDRLAGFTDALGDGFRAELVEHADFTQGGGAAATARLLARAPDLDAIFVANDLMAAGALTVLRREGRRVPDDVAVIGFDDIDLAAATDPPLSTVRQHTVEQGRRMAALLLDLLQPSGAVPGTGQDAVVLPVELVLRDSA